MKILRTASKKTVKFRTLDIGATFTYKDNGTTASPIYIKIAEVKDKHFPKAGDLNAVRLNDNGFLDYFKDEADVTIIEGTWVEDGIELPQDD